MLPTLHITAEHVRDGDYVGPDVSAYEGDLADSLGRALAGPGEVPISGATIQYALDQAGLVLTDRRDPTFARVSPDAMRVTGSGRPVTPENV